MRHMVAVGRRDKQMYHSGVATYQRYSVTSMRHILTLAFLRVFLLQVQMKVALLQASWTRSA